MVKVGSHNTKPEQNKSGIYWNQSYFFVLLYYFITFFFLTIKDKKGSPGSYSTTANIFKQLEIKEIGLYLLRPDWYIAYRNQPIDLNKLVSYLNTIFNDWKPPFTFVL